MNKWTKRGLALSLAATLGVASACGSPADESGSEGKAFRIDVSAHMTGNGSDFYASRVEGLRVFIEDLNAKGGVNGRKIDLKIRDNRGDPTTATAQAQEASDGDALLTILSSASSTIQPYANVTTQSKIPSFILGPCYPPAAQPGGAPNWFCAGPNPITDSNAMLDIYFDTIAAKHNLGSAKPAYVSSDGPGNIAVFEKLIRPAAEKRGAAKNGYLTKLPFAQGDFGSAANAIIDSGANSVIAYSIPTQQNGVAEALVNRGFKGPYVMLGNAPGTADALLRMKDPSVYAVDWVAPFEEKLAMHKTVEAAASKYKASAPPADLMNGWVLGMMLEASLDKCGNDCSREGLVKTIDGGITLDSPELAEVWGSALPEWNAKSHTTSAKEYVLVHYDAASQGLARVSDWVRVDELPFAF